MFRRAWPHLRDASRITIFLCRRISKEGCNPFTSPRFFAIIQGVSSFMPIYKMKNEDFFKRWSSEMAYVLGFFAADGSMIPHKNGGHYIEFTSTDRILLEHVQGV